MKKTSRALLLLPLFAVVLSATACTCTAQKAIEPLPAADVTIHPAYVKQVAREAYIWGWPMINLHNRRVMFFS